ncbi:calcyclin-binding protein [Teleopsis dalmanni]|uniref:calcyclin-binding protein-like n=1 Tax=Teleopsis dalmanni TaxID=139649 RepID=UPI000D32A4D9|nr:calcyclin-binding protein-like [Teleopsis dalmanni]XP_037940397.1 calcyclin-binding protein [Teleopsis dalmanni]
MIKRQTMSLEELKKDSAELTLLLGYASRQKCKDILIKAKAEVDKEVVNLEIKERLSTDQKAESGEHTPKRYLKELNEYAWDQSEKFVQLFVTLDGIQKVEESNVNVTFNENSVTLLVSNLDNKDYNLVINNLLSSIDVEKSYRKIKTGMVAIYMKKKKENVKWEYLTTIHKRLQEKKDEEMKADTDSNEDALVGIMKKMYNSGDSKVKQMIAKAWTESQDKRNKGENPMDD